MSETGTGRGPSCDHYDLVIVGGAMAGASLACGLADSGLRIALLDRAMPGETPVDLPPGQFEPRVSALTPASIRFLEELGAWPPSRSGRCRHMLVREADGTASIRFDAEEVQANTLVRIVENRLVVGALHQRLADEPDVDRVTVPGVRSIQPEGEGLFLILEDGRRLHTRLLVGADGARSTVRRLGGFRTREWEYGHHAIVTTVRTERPHKETARQRFSDDGVLAFLPLHDQEEPDGAGHYSSIVWSVVPEQASRLLALDDEAFATELGRASEYHAGPVTRVAERFSFPLHQCHATEYVRGRIVLIGDAAHSIHPLAGQGANLGLRDADVLARLLSGAVRDGLPCDEPALLRRYQRSRMGQNLAMTAAMEGFRRLYADQPLPLRWLRNTGMRTVDRLAPVKHRIIREAMGL